MSLADVGQAFRQNFEERGEIGASVAVWREGREVLSLAAGFCDRAKTVPWRADTPVLVWSATKGPAAACLLKTLDAHNLNLETRVAEIWQEFAQSGKEAMTIGEILSHRGGLAALDDPPDVLDHDAVADALARQPPAQIEGHAYHPRTFGFLLDELVRRIDGRPLGTYWREEIAEPLGLDFWIGVPAEMAGLTAPAFPAKAGSAGRDAEFYAALARPDSLTSRAFASPRGLHSVASMNTPAARMAALPAFGGIGTADALAKFYSRALESSPRVLGWMTTTLSSGFDAVLMRNTAFSAGFMRDIAGVPGSFGHPGAGGSVAFADPARGIGFAYVMNQMETGVLPGERALSLVSALYK